MTQQEIQDRNVEIARMLGYKTNWLDKLFYTWKCRFLYDWNLLMEVVEFIRLKNWSYDMYCPSDIMDTDGLFECNFWDKINPEIEGRSKNSLKEAVFIAVSDFAKKFNNKEL